jgi:hypothetical protein
MDVPDRWERWAPISGLVFVVAFLGLFFGFFVPADELPASATAIELADYYRGRGEGGFLFMYLLIGLSGAALLWFAGSLRASLRRVEPAPGRLSDIAFGGGVASAILLLTGGAALLSPFTVLSDPARTLDPALNSLVGGMGFIAINFGLIAAAVMIVATSLVALRWRGLTGFAWVGFLTAAALALNILYFFGLFVWVGWVLLTSVLLLGGPATMARGRGRPAVEVPR